MIVFRSEKYKGFYKGRLKIERLIELISPMREKREYLLKDKGELINILKKGTELSRNITDKKCREIKDSFGILLF